MLETGRRLEKVGDGRTVAGSAPAWLRAEPGLLCSATYNMFHSPFKCEATKMGTRVLASATQKVNLGSLAPLPQQKSEDDKEKAKRD